MKRKQPEHQELHEGEKKPNLYSSSINTNNGGNGALWVRGDLIGRGSYGSVYLANLKNPKLKYSYLPPSMAVKSAEVSVSGTVQKEKEVFINLQGCPNVVKYYGEEITTADNGNMVFNLMLEHASGGDLNTLIEKFGGCGLPFVDVRRYTRAILRGLKHVHECGYVHCDLKPQNILLVPVNGSNCSKFVAKIGDFGLAKRAMKQNKTRVLDPYLRGTPLYLSPEVVNDNVQESASDIWALGCIVLEMLTGKPAWCDDDDTKGDLGCEALLDRIANENELPQIPKEIPQEGKEFLKGCFVRNPALRSTAEVLLKHRFVTNLEEDIIEENVDELEDESEDDEFELSDSYLSDDELIYSSGEESIELFWFEKKQKQSIVTSNDTTQQCIPPTFTVQAGV